MGIISVLTETFLNPRGDVKGLIITLVTCKDWGD